jgi:hypothetical protein
MSTWPYDEDRIEITSTIQSNPKVDFSQNMSSSVYDDFIKANAPLDTKSSTNRFDLEQEILNCWRVVDDLKILYENVLENSTLDRDEVANILIGLSQLYEMRFDKTFRIFEECIVNKKI